MMLEARHISVNRGGTLVVRDFSLAARPKPAELAAMAEAWRPWRGVAARLLWAYYAVLKRREGINA